MRDERMCDEDHSHAPMSADVLAYVRAHPNCPPTEVLDALGDNKAVRYAMADMLDTGELDWTPARLLAVIDGEPRGRFM